MENLAKNFSFGIIFSFLRILWLVIHFIYFYKEIVMENKNQTQTTSAKNTYDDGNIPEIDLPRKPEIEEPLPEYTRPRKDGPGGE